MAMSKDGDSDMQTAATATHRLGPSGDYEQVFRQYHSLIVGTAYRVTGSSDDAEDVLQTVFMRLLRRWSDIDLSSNPGAYLRRAAVNASLDLLRARARSASVPLDDAGPDAEEAGDASPEQRRLDAEMRGRLRRAILALSEKSARVFTLRYLEDVDNKEIARQLGMSQTAVAVMLHRARQQVRRELGEFVGGMES
jgi:RNA polymerase sigma-70 factor (ECF subfamily)